MGLPLSIPRVSHAEHRKVGTLKRLNDSYIFNLQAMKLEAGLKGQKGESVVSAGVSSCKCCSLFGCLLGSFSSGSGGYLA